MRDGGYTNDREYGQIILVNVFDHVTAYGVEFIELGFLDDRRPFTNRSRMPDTECMTRIYGLPGGNAQLLGMIECETCSIDCFNHAMCRLLVAP